MGDLAQQRTLRTISQISQKAELGMELGINLENQHALFDHFRDLVKTSHEFGRAQIRTANGQLLVDIGATKVPSELEKLNLLATDKLTVSDKGRSVWSKQTMHDASGQSAGFVVLELDRGALQTSAHRLALQTLQSSLPLLLLSWVSLSWLLSVHIRRQPSINHPPPKLWKHVAFSVFCISWLATPLWMISTARQEAKPLVAEQLHHNAYAIGSTLTQQVDRALEYGIPYPHLQGIESWLQQAHDQAPEISAITLTPKHSAMQTTEQVEIAIPLSQADTHQLSLSFPLDLVDQQLSGILVDLILALVISIVLVYELCRSQWQQIFNRDTPLASPGPQATYPSEKIYLSRIRLFVFLAALSEELLRPFLTVFASELPNTTLSPSMSAGIPVAAFMLTLAMAQPIGPVLAQRFDVRWLMAVSAACGTAILALSGTAESSLNLIICRALAGMAYGLTLILAQTAIIQATSSKQRAQGLTQVAAAIVAAGIVGPPFGGMLAAKLGAATSFIACAACMAAALWIALKLPTTPSIHNAPPTGTNGWRGYQTVLQNPQALFVIFGAALPARLVAVAVLALIVPLYAHSIQAPAAVTGRVLLLYFLAFALTVSFFARQSDRSGNRLPYIVAGGIVSALACLCMPWFEGVVGMALCCGFLGLGQAMQSSPQVALITEAFEPHNPKGQKLQATPQQALAAFRLLERAGSVLAPFLLAVFINWWGYLGALSATGLLLMIATASLYLGLHKHSTVKLSPANAPQ